MLSRSAAQTARLAARPARRVPSLVAPLRSSPAPSLARTYASPAGTGSGEGHGQPVTSGPHSTVPHTPPKPTPFFARKNIGLEVTPLMAFVGTIVTVATGFLIKNLITEDSIQHRHGVVDDDELKKAINSDGKDTGK
ncbi:hypothetical protein JCM10450v2_000407 [Rhodotorula kratochvilovae]